jgi:diguanylate cyclase (GGDEF)-like protein/PAS domain S-box-containing protein
MHSAHALPVMIVGAGLSGTALLDVFLLEENVNIIGVVDHNPAAIGLGIAHDHEIPTFGDAEAALRHTGPCMVFNMTQDRELGERLARHVGVGSVIGAREAAFFWNVISRLQSVKCELLENEVRTQAVIENVREGIISITSNGVIETANPATETIFGYLQNELIGQSVGVLIPKQGEHGGFFDQYMLNGKGGLLGGQRAEVTAVNKQGVEFPIEISIAETVLGGKQHFVAMVRDITERKIAHEKLTRMALYDSLTGLPNRTNFFEKLEFSLAHARRNHLAVGLLFIDLDGFKGVNDRMGHAAGDHLLQEVALRLQRHIRESDIAARMGGDEFTIILNDLKSPDDAILVAQKLLAALSQPVLYEDHAISHIGASIGIALFPDHSKTEDGLINQADGAMYRAKAAGKNRYVMC